MKIRISLVDYLNSAPLGWAFLHGSLKERFEVVPSSPARCADQLASGEVDVGLIPSIEYQRIANLHIVPGIAIAAKNQVRSVLMVRPKGNRQIRSLAVDTNSRTSVVLLKLLLQMRMGWQPEFVPHPPDLCEMLRRCDAALLIGDAALRLSPDEYQITDLAEEWITWQHCPFVFAFWACRADLTTTEDLVQTFHEARRWGLESRAEIVASYARLLKLPESFLRDYLHFHVDYNLGARHLEGLKRFFQLAYDAQLIPALKPLRFLPVGIPAETPA